MTERKFKKYLKKTVYDLEKSKKMNNFTFLNKTVCKENQAVIAGDSITELFNMELLDCWREENDTVVYNRGISGDTSNRLVERFRDNVLIIKPKKIVLLIGINDLSAGADPEYIAGNVNKILEMIHNEPYDIQMILQAVYPINTNMNLNLKKRKIGPKIIAELNGLLKKSAMQYGAAFLDFTDELSDKDGMFDKKYTYDGLHPNARGFAVVAEKLTELL